MQSNAQSLAQLFHVPNPAPGQPTTAQLQSQVAGALALIKLASFYSQLEVPQLQSALTALNNQIQAQAPAPASDAQLTEESALSQRIEFFNPGLTSELTNLTNAVNAWYLNMTGGGAYTPLFDDAHVDSAFYPASQKVSATYPKFQSLLPQIEL